MDGICNNDCHYSYDNDCDDGGANSDYDLCGVLGSDCHDCGPRDPAACTDVIYVRLVPGAHVSFYGARFDRLLAAHALSIGATVVTNNEADFADVPGLKIENWTV